MASELPAFVLKLLADVAKSEGFTLYKIETSAGCMPGDGILGVILGITIIGERLIKRKFILSKLHLICKMAPENEARRREFKSASLFAREVHMYQHVLPLFAEFQRDRGLSDDECFLAYPKLYAAVVDEANEHFALILEDLRARNFSSWPKSKPITKSVGRLIAERLAKLHAISFALRDQRPEVFETMRCLTDLLAKFFEEGNTIKFLASMYDRAKAALTDPTHAIIMQQVKEQVLEICHECVNFDAAEPFSVVSHGDCWISNMMFQYENDDKSPSDMYLVDWQIGRTVSPAIDWHHAMVGCYANEAFRQSEYENLVNHYHHTLSSQIRLLGSDPERLFSLDDFRSQLWKFGKYGFIQGPAFTQLMLVAPSDAPDLDELSENAESDGMDLISGYNAATQKEHDKRQNELFRHLVGLGYWN